MKRVLISLTCILISAAFGYPGFAASEEEGDYAWAIPVPGQPGMIRSPHHLNAGLIDARGLKSGIKIRCPFTSKIFRVPGDTTPKRKPEDLEEVKVEEMEKAPAAGEPENYRWAIPVRSRPGRFRSPHDPDAGLIDARGLQHGTKIRCPFSSKIIQVPVTPDGKAEDDGTPDGVAEEGEDTYFDVDGDESEFDPETEVATFESNAEITLGLATLKADAATIDMELGEIVATGDAELVRGDEKLTGERIRCRVDIEVRDDRGFIDPKTLVATAEGNAVIHFGLGTLKAGSATYDLGSGEIVATGNAELKKAKGGEVLTGGRIRCDVETGEVQVSDIVDDGSSDGRGKDVGRKPGSPDREKEVAENPAVEASNAFAFGLYRQLARDDPGGNVFFSPYSISSTLAMAAEGARGETALQMGTVLRYPESAATGDAETPWDMDPIHAGLSALGERFNREEDPEEVAEMRAKIVEWENQLHELDAQIDKARDEFGAQDNKAGNDRVRKEVRELQDKKEKVAAEVHALRGQVNPYALNVANALWAERTYPFKKAYFAKMSKFYKTGGIFPADFINAADEIRVQINSRVEDMTEGRIKGLIPEGAVGRLTRLVLVNAIYFKGEWSVPFLETSTRELDFTLADGSKVKRATMHARSLEVAHYGAFEADGSFFKTPKNVRDGREEKVYPGEGGFAVLELPYKGDEVSMLVIAPNDPGNLAAIEEMLDAETVAGWIGALKKREVHVYLPKFKVEAEYTLGNMGEPGALQKMGMERAFVDPRDPKGAVFDGMSHAKSPTDKLCITHVFHKAFVEVNEKGTEAAAATAGIMEQFLSLSLDTPFTPTFKADRPFLYLIRDRATGTILFLGRMMDPITG